MNDSYQQFRKAWDSGQLFAVDRVAEKLSKSGYAKSNLYDALEKLLLEIRKVGADDETEEKILGVMDRLTGWCDPNSQLVTREPTPTNGKPSPATSSVTA